jgi:hypothetical protein
MLMRHQDTDKRRAKDTVHPDEVLQLLGAQARVDQQRAARRLNQ